MHHRTDGAGFATLLLILPVLVGPASGGFLGATIATHAPICVTGDLTGTSTWELRATYGIIAGLGTAELPYTIAGWTISDGHPPDTAGTGCQFAAAIQFIGTRQHFLVAQNVILGDDGMTQGILVYQGASNVTIRDNAFDCAGCGGQQRAIDIVNTPANFTVSGNRMAGFWTAIRVGGVPAPAVVDIRENRMSASGGAAVEILSVGLARIERNNVSLSDVGVLFDSGVAAGSIQNSTFYKNRIGVLGDPFVDGLGARMNNLLGNLEYGIFVESPSCEHSMDVRLNYWNHPMGANQTGGDGAGGCVEGTKNFRSTSWPNAEPGPI